jgi:hypothetical protein
VAARGANRKPAPPPGSLRAETDAAIAAAAHLQDRRFAGAIAALRALAEIIDAAKDAGEDAYAKASFGAIPSYVKTCEALLLTPASVQAGQRAGKGATGAGAGRKIDRFTSRADARTVGPAATSR